MAFDFSMVILTSMAIAAVRIATPILLAAQGEIIVERAGMLNIGIEGILQVSAATAFIVTFFTDNPWTGILAGLAIGGLFGLIMAVMCVTFRIDQIVMGIAVWILGWGLASYLVRALVWKTPAAVGKSITGLSLIKIPVLSQIPLIGPALFGQTMLGYIAFLLVPITAFVIFKTGFGLHVRTVGENPEAADSLGVNPFLIRYASFIIGGVMAGLAGSFLTIGIMHTFADQISAGRGFVTIAIVMFGQWTPHRVLLAALLFAGVDAVQLRLQPMLGTLVPYELMIMLPYILTLIMLVIVARKAAFPAALCIPYMRKK